MYTYNVLFIAKYVIQYCKEHGYFISNLKLQKILYFIQAEFLVEKNGTVCFNETIEAWDFGPVVPDVYHKYKVFGSSNIIQKKQYNFESILLSDRQMIDGIIEECSRYSASELVEFTHNQSPWANIYQRYSNNEITNHSIWEYFRNK